MCLENEKTKELIKRLLNYMQMYLNLYLKVSFSRENTNGKSDFKQPDRNMS